MASTFIRSKKDKDNPYVMLNKKALNDSRLSLKAKGLMAILLSLPDDWMIYESELVNRSSDGKASLSSGIKELMEHGYLERTTKRNDMGHFKGYEYVVHEVSTESRLSGIGKPDIGKPDTRQTDIGKPEVGKSEVGKSDTTNNNSTNNNSTNTNNNINKYIYNGVQETEKLKDDFVEDNHKELFENENLKAIASIYENNLGPVVGVISKDLIEISKTFQADMFEEAISIAARGGANTFNMNYIKGILRKWEDNNILNIDDLEALRNREQKAKEVSKPQKQTNYAPIKKTKFHNFQQRTDNYSEDDLERIARKKREAYYRKTQEKKQEETKEDDSNHKEDDSDQGKVINFKFG